MSAKQKQNKKKVNNVEFVKFIFRSVCAALTDGAGSQHKFVREKAGIFVVDEMPGPMTVRRLFLVQGHRTKNWTQTEANAAACFFLTQQI